MTKRYFPVNTSCHRAPSGNLARRWVEAKWFDYRKNFLFLKKSSSFQIMLLAGNIALKNELYSKPTYAANRMHEAILL